TLGYCSRYDARSSGLRSLRRHGACLATARARRREAGATEGFAAGRARRLSHGLGQVQRVVANQANPTSTESRFAQRRLHGLDERMPLELDQALAFAAADQYIEALHRHVEFQRLDPFENDPQGVVVAQIIELGAMLTFNRLDPQRLALPVVLRPLAFCVGECRKAPASRTV